MRQMMLMGIVLLAAFPSGADTIVFKFGTKLECKVKGDTPVGLFVILGEEDKGSMIIDRATIERIDYDYDSRLKALSNQEAVTGKNMAREHYELGVWCEEQGLRDRRMYARALDRYLYCKDKPGVPDEVWLRLGRMYEKNEPPNLPEALAAYSEYLKRDPASAEAKAAKERLETASAKTAQPADPAKSNDGLEVKGWSIQGAGNWANQGSARSVVDTGNNRTAVLQVRYEGTGKDKTAICLPLQGDLSKAKAIVFDVFNPEKADVRLAVAVVTGPAFEWYESRTAVAKAGDWAMAMRFDLTFSNWKCKATGWNHAVKPADLDNVRTLWILIYNGGANGIIYLDSIRIED